MNASPPSVIIIGAGIAGLASAARLAAKGYAVQLYDKNEEPGGKLGLLRQDGYSFDTGPSLFTQPYVLEDLFRDCGRRLSDYLDYTSLPVSTHYFWQDGTRLKAYTDHDALAGEIERRLHVAPTPTLRHLQRCKEAYEAIGTLFLDEPIQEWRTWASPRILRAIKALRLPYVTSTMHDYHMQELNHPYLVQLFDRFATYNGSDAYRAPAMLSMIAHLEMNEGAYYPMGGMISIPRALHRLCKDLGVACFFGTDVTAIHLKGDKATGITAAGTKVEADYIIAAGDVHHVYSHLLQDGQKARRIEKQEPSDSAFVFYWGIDKAFPMLHLHNIFFSSQDKEPDNSGLRTPNVYVNITSKMEAGIHAPEGKENWFAMIVTKAAKGNTDLLAAYRERALKLMKGMLHEDIASQIKIEAVLTPEKIEQQTLSYKGALYGSASNHPMSAFRRHPNRHAGIHNLFFAGGTVHPGGGIPLCLRSARMASDMIIDSNR